MDGVVEVQRYKLEAFGIFILIQPFSPLVRECFACLNWKHKKSRLKIFNRLLMRL